MVGTPVGEQNDTNVQIIADFLTHLALLVENTQLSTEVMIEVYTLPIHLYYTLQTNHIFTNGNSKIIQFPLL